MSDNLEQRVRNIVAEQLGVDLSEVRSDASILDDLGADSLDVVEMVMSLEEAFDIEVPDEDVEEIGMRSNAPITRDMLAPATPYVIATRMLRNLLGSYQRRSLWEKARTVARLMEAIDPEDDALN